MKICISIGLFVLGMFFWSSSHGQQTQDPHVVQITGACLVSDSLYPAPYVSIFRTRDRRGTYSNRDGYFTLPAMEGDTLIFICTGLKTSQFVVPKTEEHQIRIVELMEIAPFEMSPLYILPYPAPHELKRDVLALDLPGDGHQLFKRDEISLANYDGMADFSNAAYENGSQILQARYNGGFVSGGNLLSPDAWHQFFNGYRRSGK
jgi:hypothetical protein